MSLCSNLDGVLCSLISSVPNNLIVLAIATFYKAIQKVTIFPCDVRVTFDVYTTPMEETYQAYLLRLQRAQSNGRWRSTLENVHTGEVLHFATEREMITHLLGSLAQSIDSSPPPANSKNNNKIA